MKPLRRRCILTALTLVCALGAFAATARAQRPGFPGFSKFGDRKSMRELMQLREQYEQRALDAGRTLAEQYTNALAGLESQAAEAGDYETALAVQQRRAELAGLYSATRADTTHMIVLKPAEAKTVGAVVMDKNEKALINWRTAGSSATWDIFKVTPDSYTVTMTYSMADSALASAAAIFAGGAMEVPTGGEIEFNEVTGLLGADTGKLILALRSTGGWSNYETVTLGDIKLSRTSARLTIKAARLRGNGGLMHLKEIRLTPALPNAVPPNPEVVRTVSDEFEKIRAAHQARLNELEQPVLNAHIARLTTLGDELISKKDEEGAQAVVTESKRAQKSLGQAERISRASRAGVITEGLEEVTDARYVEDPTNTGDRFLITARDEKISVRLMSVACPPPNPEDRAGHDAATAYFGITKEDSITLGRQAQEFTASCLRDKSLRLFTRWQKDKDGSVLAVIQPEEVGDIAGILVDNGLATILEPTAKNPALRRVEESTRAALKQREADARVRPVPPGAWSLTPDAKTSS